MTEIENQLLEAYAEAFAFLGNSLLLPMNQTPQVGLDPEFWREFPHFDDDDVANALARLAEYAQEVSASAQDADAPDPVTQVSVEFTKLFVGPPKPATPPWETFYVGNEVTVGFGRPTFEMREELRRADLQLSNENNQYEDHLGLELLLLSHLCTTDAEHARTFVQAHPASWIDSLRAAVSVVAPNGYFDRILQLAQALLARFTNDEAIS